MSKMSRECYMCNTYKNKKYVLNGNNYCVFEKPKSWKEEVTIVRDDKNECKYIYPENVGYKEIIELYEADKVMHVLDNKD